MTTAQHLLTVPLRALRALRSPLGRRLTAAVLLASLFAGAVGVLYEHADLDALPAARMAAAAAPAAAGAAARTPLVTRRPATARLTPDQVAVAWYARRLKVPAGRVRALQSERLAADRVRVLVIAELGPERLDTALLTLRRTRWRWEVVR
jgi:hypothetical protein